MPVFKNNGDIVRYFLHLFLENVYNGFIFRAISVRLILIQIANIISLLKTSVMRMSGYHSKVLGLIRGMVFTVSFQSAR